jgi:hypothetical protein
MKIMDILVFLFLFFFKQLKLTEISKLRAIKSSDDSIESF